ncbi:hypothetical protein GBA52_012698 [Prunus armeniaca]|nr:hypothetical protein GBA52_012698 [Prunus armeniaca]
MSSSAVWMFPSKSCFSSLLNVVSTNPFDNGFDLGCDSGFLSSFQGNQPSNSFALMGFTAINSQSQMGTPELSSSVEFPTTRLLSTPNNDTELDGNFSLTGFQGFDGSGGAQLLNRAKPLRPLHVFPPVGAHPTLFQKGAALRQNFAGDGTDKLGNLEISGTATTTAVGSAAAERRRQC